MISKLYKQTKKRKLLVFLIFIAIVVASVLLISRADFEEDFLNVFPKTENSEEIMDIVDNVEAFDQITFNIYIKDSTDVDKLCEITNVFVDSLQSDNFSDYIANISGLVSDNQADELFSFFYDNAPLYLTDADYVKFDSILSDTAYLNDILLANYQSLMSPLSVGTKKFVLNDPLGIVSPKMQLLNDIRVDTSLVYYNNCILSHDQSTAFLFVLPYQTSNTAISKKLVEKIDNLVLSLQKEYGEDISIEYYGAVPISVDNASMIKRDIIVSVLFAIAFLFLLLFGYFRDIRYFPLIVIPGLVGGLFALGLLSFSNTPLSLITLGIGSILLGMTIDYSIHLMVHYQKTNNISKTLSNIQSSVFVSSLTTSLAFFSMLLLSSATLKQMGFFAGFSIIFAGLISLVILPLLLPKKVKKQKKHLSFDKIFNFFDNHRILNLIPIIFSVFFAFFMHRVGFTTDISESNYESEKSKSAFNHIQEKSGYGEKNVYILSSGETLNAAIINSQKVNSKADSLQTENLIYQYNCLGKILLDSNTQKQKLEQWELYWTDNKIEQLKKNYLAVGAKYSFDTNAYSKIDLLLNGDYTLQPPDSLVSKGGSLFNSMVLENNSKTYLMSLAVLDDIENFNTVTNEISELDNALILDQKSVIENLLTKLSERFNVLILFCFIAVFIVLLMFFGRIEITIITCIPIALSWIFTLGVMGFLNIDFNVFNLIICSLIFGLGVDYSIFISKAILTKRSTGEDLINSSRTAILLAALTTLIGIGALVFAKHPALQSICYVSIIGIASVLIFSLTTQTFLLKLLVFYKNGDNKDWPLVLKDIIASFLCFGMFIIGSIIQTILIIPFSLLPVKKSRKQYWYRALNCYFFKSIIFLGQVSFHKRISLKPKQVSEPCVIVSNHQSMIDLIIIASLSPKIIFMTKSWVYKNPLFGLAVRYAGHVNTDHGIGEITPKINKHIENGFSIMVFPEGTRTKDGSIKRYHRGAFKLAEDNNIPIMPILISGVYQLMPRSSFHIRPGILSVKHYPMVYPDDTTYGTTYQERSKGICNWMRKEMKDFMEGEEMNFHIHKKIIRSYTYTNPITENYVRVKLQTEKYYKNFINLLPDKGLIYDYGCGLGIMAFFINNRKPNLVIKAMDYDKEKILMAQNNSLVNENTEFRFADLMEEEIQNADSYIFSDVLHYLPYKKQEDILNSCMNKLNKNGVLIVREGNTKEKEKSKHNFTKFTEFFAKNVGFNKFENGIFFPNIDLYKQLAENKDFTMDVIANDKHSSNLIFVFKRK